MSISKVSARGLLLIGLLAGCDAQHDWRQCSYEALKATLTITDKDERHFRRYDVRTACMEAAGFEFDNRQYSQDQTDKVVRQEHEYWHRTTFVHTLLRKLKQ